MEWGEAEQSVFCIVVPFLGSSETAHCHKFCIVVLFLGSSNTAHCHTFLYCGPISGKFQYSPLLIQQVVKNRVLQRTLLTNLWAARSLRAWTSNSTAWNSSSLAVGRLAGSFWMHSRRKFCNATAQISTALTTSKPPRKESQWVFFTL